MVFLLAYGIINAIPLGRNADALETFLLFLNKDVYQESNGGKWVRYDANGHMIKGWDTNDDGTYYFDLVTTSKRYRLPSIVTMPLAMVPYTWSK